MREEWEVRWKDYYKILQVNSAAEQEVVKGAFDRLAKKYHPDVTKDPHANERMKDINEAYEVLGNLEKRSRYDLAWHQKQGKGALTMNQTEKDSPLPPQTAVGVEEMGEKLQHASFWPRLGAFFIDFTILFILTMVLVILSAQRETQLDTLIVTASLIRLAYFVGFWARWGQTPGKMVFQLKVVAADGGPIALSQATIRFLGFWLAFFILDFGFIWLLLPLLALTYYSIATDGERRGFHDKLANTRVIRVGRRSAVPEADK